MKYYETGKVSQSGVVHMVMFTGPNQPDKTLCNRAGDMIECTPDAENVNWCSNCKKLVWKLYGQDIDDVGLCG